VTGREYSFNPSKLVVTHGGGKLRVTLRNKGSLPHDVRVLQGGRDLGGTPSFLGGSRSAALALNPGRYELICTVDDHAKLGMRASLTVEK
jgi:uncharacterized cupredoxin-like copper-binding protein